MSREQFNIWFPAIVLGLVVSLVAAAFWDIIRRRTWTFVSRFWPSVLSEVGLDNDRITRAGEEQKQRVVTSQLSALSPHIITALAKPPANKLLMAKLVAPDDYDVEAQIGMNPVYLPSYNTTFTATAYFPDETSTLIINRTTVEFSKYGIGTTRRWRSSIVLQACLPVDPCVLAEIAELAKDCLLAENRCTFQLGNWAILYYNAGSVHIRELKEGDVPVNVEARWQEQKAGITMSGLYLTGAQVKVATDETSVTLRDDGPPSQGPGDLDELFLPVTDLVDVPEGDSLIYASKVVQAAGISLTVRSEATCILPPLEKSVQESIWDRLRRISLSAKRMIKTLLRIEDHQLPEVVAPVKLDLKHFELFAEHWRGVSEMEFLISRKEVVYYLHELSRFDTRDPPAPTFTRDQYSMTYWQSGLHDLNQVILFSNSLQNPDGLQRSRYFSTRGEIKFLLADFEGAIQDFNHAFDVGHGSLILFYRALAKCVLARYSEAMEDVLCVHGTSIDIQELRKCLQLILLRRSLLSSTARDREPMEAHSDQRKSEPIIIPDLLTGGEWCSPPKDDDPPFVKRNLVPAQLGAQFQPPLLEPPRLLDAHSYHRQHCSLDLFSEGHNICNSTHGGSKKFLEADPQVDSNNFLSPTLTSHETSNDSARMSEYAASDQLLRREGDGLQQDIRNVLAHDDHEGSFICRFLKKLVDSLIKEGSHGMPHAQEYARMLERLTKDQSLGSADLSKPEASGGHLDQLDALVHQLAEGSEVESAVKQMEQEDLEAMRKLLGDVPAIQNNVITARHYWLVLKKLGDSLTEGSHGMPHGQAFGRMLQSIIAASELENRDGEKIDYRECLNSTIILLKSGLPTQGCDALKVCQIEWSNWPLKPR